MTIRLSHPPRFALALLLLILASFLLPSCGRSPAKVEQPKPLACPIELTTDLRAEPIVPDGAGIVQPVTEAERKATGAFLTWLADFADWSHESDARRKAGAAWCKYHAK